jgi:mono/diheme cytochrome c family protein
MMWQFKTIAVLALATVLAACSLDKSKPNIELIQDMMESPSIKAQEYDPTAPHGISSRVPPQGTVPRGFVPYAPGNNFEASTGLKNPYAGEMTEEVLSVGVAHYNTQCMLCHGQKGEGSAKSTMAEFMALKPPTLLSDKIRGWTDGQIYHVISMGQGVMGGYAHHIPQKDRWQVVNYIRLLQKESKE